MDKEKPTVVSIESSEILPDSSSSDNETDQESKFKQSLMKAGRNAASRFATSKAASMLIDDTYKTLLSVLKKSIAHHTGDKKYAKRLVDQSMRVIVKVAVLERTDELGQKELDAIDLFKIKVHSVVQTMVTFFDVQFEFDRSSLKNILMDCQRAGHQTMGQKLSQGSHDKVDEIFRYITMSNYIDRLFCKTDSMYVFAREIVPALRSLLKRKLV
ncbi:hypothetical protein ACOME3_001712 [Neoechinorhynchus agilis]